MFALQFLVDFQIIEKEMMLKNTFSVNLSLPVIRKLGKGLNAKVVAWKWLFVVYPHFVPRSQIFQLGTGLCRPFIL